MNFFSIYFSVHLLVKSSSIFVLFSKLRSQEIEQFRGGIKNIMKFLKGISRGELFLKRVKEFRNPVDDKQTTTVNKVRNFKASKESIIIYLTIFLSFFCVFAGIQMVKFSDLKSNAIDIRLRYSQIKNNGFYNIYQNLGVINIMQVIEIEQKGVPLTPDVLQNFDSLLQNIIQKSYRFQLNSGLPTFKTVFNQIESVSACEILQNSSFSCTSHFEEVYFLKSIRSTFMNSVLLMKKFSSVLNANIRKDLIGKSDLMAEANTLTQSLLRLVLVFDKINENLNSSLQSVIEDQLARAQFFIIIETFVSVFMLIFGGFIIYYYLNKISMENSSFIKVLPFDLIVKNQYFKIYLNKNKY